MKIVGGCNLHDVPHVLGGDFTRREFTSGVRGKSGLVAVFIRSIDFQDAAGDDHHLIFTADHHLIIIIQYLQLIEDDTPQPRDTGRDTVCNLLNSRSHFHFHNNDKCCKITLTFITMTNVAKSLSLSNQ